MLQHLFLYHTEMSELFDARFEVFTAAKIHAEVFWIDSV